MESKYKILLLITLILGGWGHGEAQILKKLKKRAAEAAEETILRKVEEKTAEETEKTMDTILEAPGKKIRKKKGKNGNDDPYGEGDGEYEDEEGFEEESDLASLEIYSKFDFVPGDQPLFFDDFESDYIGDFPSKWNTNGGGEVVSTAEGSEKWYEMKSGYTIYHIPDVPQLPEEYTIEFDLLAIGIDQQTASTTVMKVILSDDPGFQLGNYAYAQMSFCQYAAVGLWVRNSTKDINNEVSADIREAVLNQPHISIAVNKQRFRMWVDEMKVVDIPRLVPAANRPDRLKFELINFKDGKERLFIRNLKVAEGGQDLRRQLIEQGSVSTNGILFDSGSANLQPQSLGIIRQISQVLQQDISLNLLIVGHTDADGDEAANKDLSLRRAQAVKGALVSVYGIDPGRLEAEGKGESEPVAENSTSDGKAKNRRVQFVKL
ncbi:OmpA family protein [Robiginitalea sp. IMCC43444]|uniref:OmpA family protein n=1 Tax=Robiginitalea sp. IMCC43444 TaxID=3459121 RepID=UPI0040428995